MRTLETEFEARREQAQKGFSEKQADNMEMKRYATVKKGEMQLILAQSMQNKLQETNPKTFERQEKTVHDIEKLVGLIDEQEKIINDMAILGEEFNKDEDDLVVALKEVRQRGAMEGAQKDKEPDDKPVESTELKERHWANAERFTELYAKNTGNQRQVTALLDQMIAGQ